jgi:hypothetical protein
MASKPAPPSHSEPNHRLIIERGGYSPQTDGPRVPPTATPKPLNEGYRPNTDGRSIPPTQTQTQPATTGTKK